MFGLGNKRRLVPFSNKQLNERKDMISITVSTVMTIVLCVVYYKLGAMVERGREAKRKVKAAEKAHEELEEAIAKAIDMPQWYVRKGKSTEGPLRPSIVRYSLLAGTISAKTLVSNDGETWENVTQVPELIPDQLLNQSYKWEPTT